MANEKEIVSLEAKIASAIKSIGAGSQTPQQSGIGKMRIERMLTRTFSTQNILQRTLIRRSNIQDT